MKTWTLCLAILAALAASAVANSAKNEKKIVCYFGSWAVYRPGKGKFDISYIKPELCTHAIYTFVGITTNGDIRVLDSWQDLPDNWGKDGFGRFNKLRERNPKLKTIVAIGGWNEGSAKYSEVAGNPAIRARFVQNAVAFVKKHGFDGFDLDWEYPNQRGGKPSDVQNYIQLLKEMRAAFDKENLILSAAVAAAESSASKSYIIPEMSKYLHFINLMAYDLHGAWEKVTGVNAPLYSASWESADEKHLSVNASVNYWLQNGAPPEKLILGVPFYGRAFTLADAKQNSIKSPTYQAGKAGPYTREPGMLGYNEICEKLQNGGWTVVREAEQRVPYAYNGNQWVGYDDIVSIKEKAEYAKSLGLGGAMLWSIETDDFKGVCGEDYPLLKTLNNVLRNGPPVSVTNPTPDSSVSPAPKPTTPVTHRTTAGDVPVQPPSEGSNYQCTRDGYARDPEDCSKFYNCRRVDGVWQKSEFRCADGLAFDTNINGCNYKDKVSC